MNKEQFQLLIREACKATGQTEVYVIGSQAIHAVLPDGDLPPVISRSREADMFPARDDQHRIVAGRLEAMTGVMSELDIREGIYVDTVDPETATLPAGWRGRVLRVPGGGEPEVWGLCPEPNDLCVSKLARADEKDLEFVTVVIRLGFADPETVRERLTHTDLSDRQLTRIESFLTWIESGPG